MRTADTASFAGYWLDIIYYQNLSGQGFKITQAPERSTEFVLIIAECSHLAIIV